MTGLNRVRRVAFVVSCGVMVAAVDARAGVEIIEGPIVDGRRASAGDILATVSLTTGGESVCTGTLIAPQVVITAAHCVVDEDDETGEVFGVNPPSNYEIVAGVVDVADASSGQRYPVSRIVVHPGYPNDTPSSHPSGAARYDDVAIMVLGRAVGGMSPAVVPTVNEAMGRLTNGTQVIISGYGATSPNTDDSGILYTAETSFETRIEAEIVLGSPSEPDTCPGDSGGPAYLKSGSTTWVIGITSRASANAVATCGEGGVYAFAPAYRDWFVSVSDGLYTASGPVGPVEPVDPNDPDPNDPDPNDPGDEDCEEYEEDGEIYEICYDDEDDGCAGGGANGPMTLMLLLSVSVGVVVVLRRRRKGQAAGLV